LDRLGLKKQPIMKVGFVGLLLIVRSQGTFAENILF